MKRRVRDWAGKLDRLFEPEPVQMPELILCGQDDLSATPTILVHGYLASQKFSQQAAMVERIKAASPDHSYLLNWSSGRYFEPLLRSYDLKALFLLRFYFWSVPAYLASRAVLEFFRHYKQMEERADRLGRELPTLLAAQLPEGVERINLCGHSLGTRVVVEAMLQPTWRLEVEQCVLMAGALGQHRDWGKILGRLQGDLHNFHSDRDKILLLKPDKEICIGRHGILARHPRIHNHDTQLRHSDYWDKLPALWLQAGLSPA